MPPHPPPPQPQPQPSPSPPPQPPHPNLPDPDRVSLPRAVLMTVLAALLGSLATLVALAAVR